jgi:enoyl-CoA hydratase
MALIEYEVNEQVGIITINRPEALNALNNDVVTELGKVIDAVDLNTVRCLILRGAGDRAFAAGADIAQMATGKRADGKAFSKLGNDVFRKLEQLPIPSIAAINGFALGGGCELSMSCDIRLASETAVFGQPEVGLGITPGFGGTQRMARLVGMGKAKELIYTARNIKAPEALAIGLVQAVYPADQLMAEAEKMAKRIANNAPIAVRMSKKSIAGGIEMPLDEGITFEEDNFGECFETKDQLEGMAAFLEKRKHNPFVNC